MSDKSKETKEKMGRKAVDVVLLLSETMMDKAIEANTELVEKLGRKIVLNKENCLPHISLAMGCIDERDIAAIEEVLERIAKENPLGDLRIISVRTTTNSRGEKVSVFEVEKTKELQSLHKKVMEELAPYFSQDVTGEMIYGDEEVAETSLLWIKNYREKASFANFLPHITIGYGEIENQQVPMNFAASRLALCHLGNHCTCREILISIEL